jgi:hypothetical protein
LAAHRVKAASAWPCCVVSIAAVLPALHAESCCPVSCAASCVKSRCTIITVMPHTHTHTCSACLKPGSPGRVG